MVAFMDSKPIKVTYDMIVAPVSLYQLESIVYEEVAARATDGGSS
jgi:hypothetical protein